MRDARAESYAITEQAIAEAKGSLVRGCSEIDYSKQPSLDFSDVLQALLARQFQLWIVGVLSPVSTTAPLYPLIARALVDGLITSAWIAAHPEASEGYKLYSAGRMKLLAEHWRARGEGDQMQEFAAYADYLTEIAGSERMAAALPVDIGDWSGKSIRTMALEIDLKDLYDLWYSPLSADTHGEWMSLRRYYARPCDESAHPRHWLPEFERPGRRPEITVLFTQFFLMSVDRAGTALGVGFDGLDDIESAIVRASGLMVEAGLPSDRTASSGDTDATDGP